MPQSVVVAWGRVQKMRYFSAISDVGVSIAESQLSLSVISDQFYSSQPFLSKKVSWEKKKQNKKNKQTNKTHLVYIANVKKSSSLLQQVTSRKCVTLLGAV